MNKIPQITMTSFMTIALLALLQTAQSFQPVTVVGNARRLATPMTTSLSAVLTPVREPTIIEEELLDEDEDEYDELVDGLTQKLEAVEGLWFSDDFYGNHGREWVQVNSRLAMVGATATTAMVATKVTGDMHVPSGCVTWQTDSWPTEGGPSVKAQIQIRANPEDPDGFSWLPGELRLINQKQIQIVCQVSPTQVTMGTFHREVEDEDAGFQ